ncbi:MAG: DUF1080 domain-containing protein [Balneolaceae bacterium]
MQDLSAFDDPAESWRIAGSVTASLESENEISSVEGTGILVNDPVDHNGEDLITKAGYGDIDLELDYMMAKGSNSGIYLQGRYEVQLLDSWTVKVPTSGGNGGIYERWDDSRPDGQKGYQGYPPRQNASRAPGVWQHLKISFQAPRFDDNGNKIKNARILRAELNGVTIHEDVELLGPTRGAMGGNEVAQGPLRFQGDHGAIAFRNIVIYRYDGVAPTVQDLEYSIFEGGFEEEPDLDSLSASASGPSELLTTNLLGLPPDQFLLQYKGTLNSTEAGDYQFRLNTPGGSGLLKIDGKEVISLEGENEQTVSLTEGEVPFKLQYVKQASWAEPDLSLVVSGDNLRDHLLSDRYVSNPNRSKSIYVKAEDKPLLRSFRDLPGGTRLTHAISVSSLDKVHYTYDLNSGNLMQLWRGNFLNATPMWYNRGDGSSRPDGSVLNLFDNQALALHKLENEQAAWSNDTTGTHFVTKGYQLDPYDNPTFHYQMYGASVEDEIRVIEDGKGVRRTVTIQNAPENLYLRLATGSSIQETENNRYLIDDQSYYIEVDDTEKPLMRSSEGQEELLVPARSTIRYSILF